MASDKQSLGKLGEEMAVAFLKRQKYRILDRNFKTSRFGEIDIVAKDKKNGQLVFVEVKTKSSADFGSPEEELTIFKKQKLRRAIQDWFWAKKNKKKETNHWRIDLLAVDFSQNEKKPEIRHYPGCA